jgi:hypothetical protein
MQSSLWNFMLLLIPFAIAARLFRKHKRRTDKQFEPLTWAVGSGLVLVILLFGVFSIPFLSSGIWQLRRIWWSCAGAIPDGPWFMIVAVILGVLYSRVAAGKYGGMRHLTAAPIIFWAFFATPQSSLVEMNRHTPPAWRDGVCLQSTGFTCTPSAAATLLNAYGISATESEMAERCATTRRGTHVLGLARGLASKLPSGKFVVRACRLTPGEVMRAHLPCITFTCCHAWVIFAIDSSGSMEIGEAMGGRYRVSWNQFVDRFCGEAVLVTPSDSSEIADGAAREIRPSEVEGLTLAGNPIDVEVDSSGRTLGRFGSASIEELRARTESEDW